MIRNLLCITFVILLGCSPSSPEEFRREGQAIERSLIRVLKKIETREQLIAAGPRIKRLFDRLVGVMIEAGDWQDNHPLIEAPSLSKRDVGLSERLRGQLARIYQIDGGREVVEKCQRDALHRLDAFERRQVKR